jgi:hypothetical protein
MDALVIATTLAGSAGAALLLQKAALKLFVRAMEHRPHALPNRDR